MAHLPNLNDVKGDFGDIATARLYRIIIDGDDPVLSCRIDLAESKLEHDFDVAVKSMCAKCPDADKEPAYYLVHLDAPLNWLFYAYVPETTHPQKKLRYAYSQNAIKKNLLVKFTTFTESIFTSSWNEISQKGYQSHLASQKVSALSVQEHERIALDSSYVEMAKSPPIRLTPVSGSTASLGFSVHEAAKSAVASDLTVGGHIVLTMDKEAITHCATVLPSDSLLEKLSSDHACFILSRVNDKSLVFTFCCPEGTRVKDRMIASSARASVLAWLESIPQFTLHKRLEVSDINDVLSIDQMRDECGLSSDGSPKPSRDEAGFLAKPQQFNRPRPPGRLRS